MTDRYDGRFDRPEAAAMARLVVAVQELSQARSLAAIMAVVRRAARELTGADGATFVLRDGDQCFYAEENAISPLWKGRRFPMSACISGWVMLHATPAVIEDIYSDPRIPQDAYRPTFVKSLAVVPIRRSAPIAAIGNYWATRHQPTEHELGVLQALADTTSVAIENAQLYEDLQAKVETLGTREARIKAQRDALDVFARALAHDLREPVRTIRSFSQLLAKEGLGSESWQEYLRFIVDAGSRMNMLIDTVFLYTQLDDPTGIRKERLPLRDAFEAALGNLAGLITERGARVTCGELPVAEANRVQMTRVFQNLIGNSLSHGGTGVGVHVSASLAGPRWRISVKDDGPGMPSAWRALVFEPFKRYSRDDAHAGLGLSICRKIVELHGGEIGCEAEEGRGADFWFSLPAVEADAPSATSAPMPADVEARSGGESPANVLLVDDREPDIRLMRAFLSGPRGMRCNLFVARDGAEGLDSIRNGLNQGRAIDLVLLDINMPGMDGFEMLERIRADERLHGTPVVMCTGSTYDRDRERAQELGAVGYVEKPMRFEDLRPILSKLPTLRLHDDGHSAPVLVSSRGRR